MKIKTKTEIKWNGEIAKNILAVSLQQALTESGNVVRNTSITLVPVDSGTLRDSIKIKVLIGEVQVGTIVGYAKWVELGTRYKASKPYLKPGLDNNINNILNIFRKHFKEVRFLD